MTSSQVLLERTVTWDQESAESAGGHTAVSGVSASVRAGMLIPFGFSSLSMTVITSVSSGESLQPVFDTQNSVMLE